MQRKIKNRVRRRQLRVRQALARVTDFPRISVFRSAKHIYGQIIDDVKGKTLVGYSSLHLKAEKLSDKTVIAKTIGTELAKLAKIQGISKVRFDRGSFLYHGRVKALAEALRAGGLEF